MIAELGLRIHADGARQTTAELDRLTTTAGRTERATTNLSRNVRNIGGGFNRLGPQVQQASYQVADFAVQVGAGTSATRALSMQLPQLLGGFGVMGAAMGAVVAIGGALVPVLLNTGEEAASTGDAMEDLADAVSAYQEAAEFARSSASDLTEEFGSQAEAIRETLDLLQELALTRALDSLTTSAASFRAEFADLFHMMDQIEFAPGPAARMAQQQIRGVLEELNLTVAEANRLRDAISALGSADGPQQVVDTSRDLLRTLEEIYGSVDALPPRMREFAEVAAQADVAASRILGTMEDAGAAAQTLSSTDIARPIFEAANEAMRLANNLNISVQAAAALANARRQAERGPILDPRDPNYDPVAAEMARIREETTTVSPFDPSRVPKIATGGGRSGGGGGGISEAQRQHEASARRAAQIMDEARTEAERYADALAEVRDLHAGGFLSGDQAAKAIGAIRDQFEEASDSALQMRDDFSATFSSIIRGADSVGDAVGNMLDSIADRLLTQAGNSLFDGLFSGQGGRRGGLFGGAIIPGILHEGGVAGVDGYDHRRRVSASIFANAERYHTGGVAGLRPNEVPAILERGERVIPNGQGGGGTSVIELRMSPDVQANVLKQAEGQAIRISTATVRQFDRTLPGRVQQIGNDPRRRG